MYLFLHEIRKRKANWIGHNLRRNCLLQWVTEGKIQGGIKATGRQGRRCKKLLDDLKERRGYSHLKGEALDRTMWRACFGRGLGPLIRQTTKRMNVLTYLLKLAKCTKFSQNKPVWCWHSQVQCMSVEVHYHSHHSWQIQLPDLSLNLTHSYNIKNEIQMYIRLYNEHYFLFRWHSH